MAVPVMQLICQQHVHDGRTFSGKVRKLKQHRRASASRLRPPENPPNPPESPPGAPPSNAVITAPSAAISQHSQQQQHADEMQSQASSAQQAYHAQHAQQAQQRSDIERQVVQQLPLLVQQPGFGAGKKNLEQDLQAQLLEDRFAQSQLLGQLPQQLHQQPPVTKAGRRQRPTADAAGLACIGNGLQEEQGRMTQSGPLYQPSAVAPAPVPELFEVCTLGNQTSTSNTCFPAPVPLLSPGPPPLAQSAEVLLTYVCPGHKGVLVNVNCCTEIAAFAVPVTSTNVTSSSNLSSSNITYTCQ